MRNNFPNREQLMGMSLAQLRLIDIQEKDEEELLQEIVLLKEVDMPPIANVYRGDIPDIKTPQEEAHFQDVINQRVEERQPKVEIAEIPVHLSEIPVDTTTTTTTTTNAITENKCEVCSKVFKTAGALRMHKGRFHK